MSSSAKYAKQAERDGNMVFCFFRPYFICLFDRLQCTSLCISCKFSFALLSLFCLIVFACKIYFGYCVALYLIMAVMNFYDPQQMVNTYYGGLEVGPAGAYYAKQTSVLMVVMAYLTVLGWISKSGPVKDLLIKCHFAHHFFVLVMDWYCESQGFITKEWQQGVFSPHPFFTFLVYFLWYTDKSRNLEREELEAEGKL